MLNLKLTRQREGETDGQKQRGGGSEWSKEVSKLVFYAQSTSAVISGRLERVERERIFFI